LFHSSSSWFFSSYLGVFFHLKGIVLEISRYEWELFLLIEWWTICISIWELFSALATIVFSSWFACLLNHGHLSYALITKNVEGSYLAQSNTSFLNGQMNQYICFVAIRSNVWCRSWHWSFDDYKCGRHEASWTRRGNGRFLTICVHDILMQFQLNSAGISECEENTTFTEVDKHTVFYFNQYIQAHTHIHIYGNPCSHINLYLLKCSSFVPPLW
jgi:hypothetical protein